MIDPELKSCDGRSLREQDIIERILYNERIMDLYPGVKLLLLHSRHGVLRLAWCSLTLLLRARPSPETRQANTEAPQEDNKKTSACEFQIIVRLTL